MKAVGLISAAYYADLASNKEGKGDKETEKRQVYEGQVMITK